MNLLIGLTGDFRFSNLELKGDYYRLEEREAPPIENLDELRAYPPYVTINVRTYVRNYPEVNGWTIWREVK